MLNRNISILFISAFQAPFVQDDIDVLSKHFVVRKCIGSGILQVIRIILSAFQSDVIFCWFASVYSSVAVAVGKFVGIKAIIVVGGVDVAKEKELGYGIWLSPWKARLLRYAFHHAHRILVVDPSLKEEAMERANYDGANIRYLPTTYDSFFWKPVGIKEPVVLTVAVADDEKRIRLKGIDTLLEAARRLPYTQFIVIGVDPNLTRTLQLPANVNVQSRVERKQLLPYYRQAKVFCQPSLREGLPNTLCEAMLCGCIPVATRVGGNPTAVGDSGVLVPPSNAGALAEGIRQALAMPEEAGAKARARIVALFPKEKRERELVRLVEELAQ